MADMINHPPHYTFGNIECIDAIQAALGPEGFVAYCRGTAIKYNWRAGLKDDAAEDLQKGAWYDQKGAEVAEECRGFSTLDQLLGERDSLRAQIQEREIEIQRWAEAQEAVRAQWVQIVEALGAIVPVIEGETTMTMVKRIQSLVSGLAMYKDLYNAAATGSVFDVLSIKLKICLKGLHNIAEGDSGSLAVGQWMAQHAAETIQKVESPRG